MTIPVARSCVSNRQLETGIIILKLSHFINAYVQKKKYANYGHIKSENKYTDLLMISACLCRFNPLGPHDALKHHNTSLETDLIFLQLRV